MRRKDREMNKEFGLKIIDAASYGVVSVIDEKDQPYGLPLSIVRGGDKLYFHGALEGKKADIFKNSPHVSIMFVGNVEVPENYSKEELEIMKKDPSKARMFISSVFTTEFESAMVKGIVKRVEDHDEKIKAMKLICKKYTPSKMAYFDTAIQAGLGRTEVYAVEIQEVTAKRKKYDPQGKEMKKEGLVNKH